MNWEETMTPIFCYFIKILEKKKKKRRGNHLKELLLLYCSKSPLLLYIYTQTILYSKHKSSFAVNGLQLLFSFWPC